MYNIFARKKKLFYALFQIGNAYARIDVQKKAKGK